MVNFIRAVFFGSLAAAALAGVSGVGWLLGVSVALAALALAAFLRTSEEQVIPLERYMAGLSPTKPGWATLFFILFIFVSALQTGANLLFFLSSLITAMLAGAFLYSLIALKKTTVSITLPPWCFAGETVTAGGRAVNGKRGVPIVALCIEGDAAPVGHIKASVPVLPAGATVGFEFDFTPERRGTVKSAGLEVWTDGLIGLTRRSRKVNVSLEAVVYPALAEVGVPPLARRPRDTGRSFASREGEFAGLRDWRPGDSPKHIHWRSSARTGRIVTKEFILTERPEIAILLDTFGTEGEEFEALVSRAAGLAVAALRQSYDVSMFYYDEGVRIVEDEGTGALPHRILRSLAEVRPQETCRMEELVRRSGIDGSGTAAVFEITSRSPGVRADREAVHA